MVEEDLADPEFKRIVEKYSLESPQVRSFWINTHKGGPAMREERKLTYDATGAEELALDDWERLYHSYVWRATGSNNPLVTAPSIGNALERDSSGEWIDVP
jgi:hypothetical protein